MAQDGGYDVEFVAKPTFETSCSICLLTLKEPVQVDSSCGHRFCKGCIEKLRRGTDGQKRCPNDQQIIKNWFPDHAVERDILNLEIKCTMPIGGCVWTGELRNLENHLEICEFYEIPCVNENCRENMERRNLITHLKVCRYRIVECNFCSEKYIFNDKKKHEDECIKYLLNCPNECGATISRDLMDDHIKKECPNTIHPCEYIKIGCQIKGTRSELDQHLEDATNKHLSQAVERIDHQNDRISQQNGQIELLFQKVFKTKPLDLRVNPFIFPINNFDQKFEAAKQNNKPIIKPIKPIKKVIYSDPFYFLDGYRAQVCVVLNRVYGDKIRVSLFFQMREGLFDDFLDWPFKGFVRFSLQGKGKNEIKMQCDTTKVSQIDNIYQKPTNEENCGRGFTKSLNDAVIEDYETDDPLIITCQVERVEC